MALWSLFTHVNVCLKIPSGGVELEAIILQATALSRSVNMLNTMHMESALQTR